MKPKTARWLRDDDFTALCRFHRIRASLPSSQIEAEAVHRRVDQRTIARAHLILRLRKVGVL